jgi:ATP-dependent DNA helicase RecG
MTHAEIEKFEDFQKKGIQGLVPVYPSTEKLVKKGITKRVMQNLVRELFKQTGLNFKETLPEEVIRSNDLMSKSEALRYIHFPPDLNLLAKAQYRLKFEELFYLQLQLLLKRQNRKKSIRGFVFERIGDYFNKFYSDILPFDLTDAQKRVIKEIRRDVKSGRQMNRLLQGDVGSGKTVVAMMSMLMALDNDYQAALLAPTEILAQQHYFTVKNWAEKLNIHTALLTGSSTLSERKKIHEGLENGNIRILIGTHAILEDKVKFKNLGLAVIDEQHRFGVAQRAKMWRKNTTPPHILIMTATPIPRTLALTHYGDLDVSVIDELPPGRKPVQTHHVFDTDRNKVYDFLKNEIEKGRQAYIVFPLIEESEMLDYENLENGYQRITNYFKNDHVRIGMVHGRMKPAEKEAVMQKFKAGDLDILVSTTVIEVGVDVPNASIMVIESAQRFGLSQLHQLRGRVGRGAEQSYCILITDKKLSDDAKIRIRTMTETNDGFKIAEVDLKLRGPGNIMGTQQSGIIRLKIADFVRDTHIMLTARKEAKKLLALDPGLTLPENQIAKEVLKENFKKSGFWNYIG